MVRVAVVRQTPATLGQPDADAFTSAAARRTLWCSAAPEAQGDRGLTLGPVSLLAIVALYVLVSFVEGNVLVPAIEGRSFALRPAVVGPVITIGLALGGAFGAVLAMPAASAARDIYLYVFRRAAGVSPSMALEVEPIGSPTGRAPADR